MNTALVVIFDVDDTLYLERNYAYSGFKAVDRHLRASHSTVGFAEAAWQAFLAGARGNIFDHVLAHLNVPTSQTLLEELVNVYRSHRPGISLLPDAAKALRDLTELSAQIGVVTDGPASSQRAKVDALGLREVAHPIIITDERDPGWSKPGTLAFKAIQGTLGSTSSRFAYIADNPTKDFAAPRALNWSTFRVRRSGGLHQSLPSGDDVDHEADDLMGLLKFLAAQA